MAALQSTRLQGLSRCRPAGTPFLPACSSRNLSVRVRAEGEASSSSSPTPAAAAASALSTPPPAVQYIVDNESIKDVFLISGPAPEKVQGRLAMLGFAFAASSELSTHTPVLEQFGEQWFGVVALSLLIATASLLPKAVAGVPLKELHEAAKGDGIVKYFSNDLETWTGRVAMIGITGLTLLEVFKGDALF